MINKQKPLFSIPLVRELTAVLIIKLILIFSIKSVFFSDPVDMSNPQESVSQKFGLSTSDYNHPSQSEDLK